MNLRNKKDLTFLAAGVLILFIVVVYAVWVIRFLTDNIGKALNDQSSAAPAPTRFQLEKAEEVLKK